MERAAIRISIPEPTSEQRRRRELGPVMVTVTSPVVTDPEAFRRSLWLSLLRAMTGEVA